MSTQVNPAKYSPIATAPVRRAEHRESSFTRVIEQQSTKIPSHLFLSASLAAMAISAALEAQGNTRAGRFIGSWAAPLLVMGVYNKLVKSFGVD